MFPEVVKNFDQSLIIFNWWTQDLKWTYAIYKSYHYRSTDFWISIPKKSYRNHRLSGNNGIGKGDNSICNEKFVPGDVKCEVGTEKC